MLLPNCFFVNAILELGEMKKPVLWICLPTEPVNYLFRISLGQIPVKVLMGEVEVSK